MASGVDKNLLDFVAEQLVDPELYLSRVTELYSKPTEESIDQITFKDGRNFERISRPLYIGNDIKGRVWSFRDNTKQWIAEKALILNEAKFFAAFDQSPVGSVICDLDKKFLKCNQAFCNFLGYQEEELIGKTVEEITFPEDIRVGMKELEKLIEKKVFSAPVQKRYVTKDGRNVWGEVKISIVMNERNSPQFVLAVIQDINERKQLEDSLNTTRWELQAIYDNTPVMLALVDSERRILFSNAAFNEFSGLLEQSRSSRRAGETLGCINAFDDPQGCGFGKNCEKCALRLAISDTFNLGSGFHNLEVRVLVSKQGEQQELALLASTVPIQEEGKQNLLLCLTDITENVEKDEALKKQNEFNRLIVETANEGILSIDLDSNIQYANHKMGSIIGYTIEEVIGKSVFSFMFPEDIQDHHQKIALRKEGAKGIYERRLKHRNGNEIWTLISSTPIKDKDGMITGSFGMVQDITDRKIAESEIRQKEEKYIKLFSLLRIMTDTMPDMIWAKDIDKRYIFANKSICKKLLNASDTTEPIGKSDMFFAQRERERHPENPAWHTFGELCMDSDAVTLQEMKELQFDEYGNVQGKFLYLDVHKAPLFNQEGELIGVVGSARDITERKLAEEKLKISEERYSLINNSSRDSIYSYDSNGRFTSANANLCRILNLEPSQIIGRTHAELGFNEQQCREWEDLHKKVYETDNTVSVETFTPLLDGVSRYFEIILNPLHDQQGNIIGIGGTTRDITKRKLAEIALSESEEKYRILLENSGVGVGVFSIDGIIQLFNQKALMNMGGKVEDFIGRSVLDVFGADTGATYINRFRQCAQSEICLEYEDLVEISGKKRWFLSAHTRIINAEGKILGILVVSHDITDRKLSEDELIIAKEKAEESDKFKTAFLQNISHEIRTPMNAIIGFSRLINKEDLAPEKRNNYCNIIVQSSEQLMSLVNDIITISSLETKQEKVFPEEVNLNKLMSDLHAIFAMQLAQQEISLVFHPGLPDQQALIFTDKGKINQVLSNLLTNSRKFTQKGSIEFGYNKKDTELEFFVKDTGIGIRPEVQDKIFDRFHQADLKISREYGGTGLGLAICRVFVELLGGKIWVESQLGKGSSFYFTLPLQEVI